MTRHRSVLPLGIRPQQPCAALGQLRLREAEEQHLYEQDFYGGDADTIQYDPGHDRG